MIINARQKKIVEIVKKHNPITGDEIAKILEISRSALRTDFSILVKNDFLISKKKKGYYYNNKCTLNMVKKFMSPKNSIDLTYTAQDAIFHLFKFDLGSIIVEKNKSLIGIISRKDLLKIAISGKNLEKIPVSMIMTRMPNIIYCYENDDISDAIEKILIHQVDSLPILKKDNKNNNIVVGRFTKTNIARLFFEKIKKTR